MNYIEIINHYWSLREQGILDAGSGDLYLYLVHKSNSLGWKNPFNQSNKLICAVINVSEPTLIRQRNILKQAGLISFESGKNLRQNSSYHLNNLSSPVSNPISSVVSSPVSSVNEKPLDYNKPKQNKTKLNEEGIADKPPPSKGFIKPVLDEVVEHFKNKNFEKNLGWPAEKITEKAEQFINYYASKGWMIGKAKMKDWRAAINGQWLKTKSWENETTTNRTGNSKSEGANRLIEKLRNNLAQRGQGDNTC